MKQRKILPLHDVQVIEFGHELAGPATAMILADLGATVIHVDKPGQIRKPFDATLNRGKKCITLNLKESKDTEKALKLIEKADVVIENFRPGVMKRLGIDFDKLIESRPDLVLLCLPGFASNDEKLRDRKATEAVIMTESGVFSKMGYNRILMGEEPSYSSLPLASAYSAVIAASAVVFALQARVKTGYGDHIEVPLSAALTEGLLAYNTVKIDPYPKRYKNLRAKEILRRQENNIALDLKYKELFSYKYMDPFFRPYRCKDRRTYYLVSISHPAHTKRVMTALGCYDKVLKNIDDMGMSIVDDRYKSKSEWGKAGSFATYPVSPEWSEMLNKEMEQCFLTKTSFEWEAILDKVGGVGGVQRTLDEWMYTEHTRESGLFVEVDDVEYGPMVQPGSIAWSEEFSEAYAEHTSREFCSPEEALKALKDNSTKKPTGERSKGWLEGKKVVDLCNVIAGPHSAAILARFGAEVIKIDSAEPTFDSGYLEYSINTGIGKRTALIDIRSKQGYEILSKLIKDADIVTFNALTRQMKDLKLDDKSIKKINPNVILCHLDCFGGQKQSTMTNTLGYDDVAQAVSGIMTRFGGSYAGPEEHAHLGTLDVMCGFAAGLSIAVSLYHQAKTGKPLRARTSLASMSGLVQLPFAYDYPDRGPVGEPSGRNIKGNHELSCFYKCSDGWIFMDSHIQELEKLEKVFSGVSKIVDKQAFLDPIFKKKTTKFWFEQLTQFDIATSILTDMFSVRDKYTTLPDGTAKTKAGSYSFVEWNKHPSGLTVNVVPPYAIQPKFASVYELHPARKYGIDTREILKEYGLDDKAIDALIDKKIVSESWSKEYFPT